MGIGTKKRLLEAEVEREQKGRMVCVWGGIFRMIKILWVNWLRADVKYLL